MSIKDIAKLAGVSPATVSRVLNNPDHRCSSEEVRERIWRIAREQNYLPNTAARDLKRGSAPDTEPIRRIDVLMTRSGGQQANPFFNEILRYVESEVHQRHAVLSSVWYDRRFAENRQCHKGTAGKMIEQLFSGAESGRAVKGGAGASRRGVAAGSGGGAMAATDRMGADPAAGAARSGAAARDDGGLRDGLIVIGTCAREALAQFTRRYRAVVSINRNPCGFVVDEVTSDGARMAEMAIDYLVGLGHRHIGYAGEVREEAWFRGYQRALVKHGLALEMENVFPSELSESAGFDLMSALMRREDAPTAVFCANDMLALGMIRCMTRLGSHYYRPSIIGCDDIEEGQFVRPMLTSLGVSKRDMAHLGVDLLFDRLARGHGAPVKVELNGKLMERESCSRVSGTDDIEYII